MVARNGVQATRTRFMSRRYWDLTTDRCSIRGSRADNGRRAVNLYSARNDDDDGDAIGTRVVQQRSLAEVMPIRAASLLIDARLRVCTPTARAY